MGKLRTAYQTPSPRRKTRSAVKEAPPTPQPYESAAAVAVYTLPVADNPLACYVLVLTSEALDCWQVCLSMFPLCFQ